MPTQALTLLDYDRTKYNVLMPTTAIQQVSPWHALRASEVVVDPDPDHGDVYEVGSKYIDGKDQPMYSLAKPALLRIAQAAGIVWNWRESGPVRREPGYVLYRAVGAIRGPDGTPQTFVEHYDVDLSVKEDELREDALRRVRNGIYGDDTKLYKGRWEKVKIGDREANRYFLDPSEVERYVADKVRAGMIHWRKNMLKLAETGAILRVIRAALGLRGAYTKEELSKRFVVPRVDFSPDYSDPNVRAAILQHGISQMAALFGAANPAAVTAALPAAGSQPSDVPPALPQTPDEAVEPDAPATADMPSPASEQEPPDDDSLPWGDTQPASDELSTRCKDCGRPIEDATVAARGQQKLFTAMDIAEMSKKHFGRELCWSCSQAAGKAAKRGGGAA